MFVLVLVLVLVLSAAVLVLVLEWAFMTEPIFDHENRQGKSQLKRIVSMLTRLIQRTDRVGDEAIEYE